MAPSQKHLAFRREVVDKVSALATAAFGLVAALAWNSAIQALFRRYFPAPEGDGAAVAPLVLYALFVTLIAVVVIIWIGRLAGRLRAEDEAKPE